MLGYQQEYQIQVKQYYKYCHHCGRHHEATNTEERKKEKTIT